MVLSKAGPLRFREALSKECSRARESEDSDHRQQQQQQQQQQRQRPQPGQKQQLKQHHKQKMFQANPNLAMTTAAMYEDHAAAYYEGRRFQRPSGPPLNIPNTWGTRGKVQTKQWLAKQRADAAAAATSDRVPYAPVRSPLPQPPPTPLQQDDEDQTVLVNPFSRPTSQLSFASRPASQLSHVSNLSRPVSQMSNHNNNDNNYAYNNPYQQQYARPSSRLATPDTFASEDFESAMISKSPPLVNAATSTTTTGAGANQVRPASRRSMVRDEDTLDPWMFEHIRRKRHGARWDENARDVHSPIAGPQFDRRASLVASPLPSNASRSSSRLGSSASAFDPDPYEQQQQQLRYDMRVYQLQQQQKQRQQQQNNPDKPRLKANSRDLIQKLRRRPTMPESSTTPPPQLQSLPPQPPRSPRDYMMMMRKTSTAQSSRSVSYAPPVPYHDQHDMHAISPSPAFSVEDHDLAAGGLMIQPGGSALPRRRAPMQAPTPDLDQIQAWRDVDESYVEPSVTGEFVDETMSIHSGVTDHSAKHNRQAYYRDGVVEEGDVTSSTVQDPLEYSVDGDADVTVDENDVRSEDLQQQQQQLRREEDGYEQRYHEGGDGAVEEPRSAPEEHNEPRRPPRRQFLINALDTIIEESQSRESSVGDKTIHSVDGGGGGGSGGGGRTGREKTPTKAHPDEYANGNAGPAPKEDNHPVDTPAATSSEQERNDESQKGRHSDDADDKPVSESAMKDATLASSDARPEAGENNRSKDDNHNADTGIDNGDDTHRDGTGQQQSGSSSSGEEESKADSTAANDNMALTSTASSMPVQVVDHLDTQLQSLSEKVNEIRAGNKSLIYQLSELMSAIAFNKNSTSSSSSSSSIRESSRVYFSFLPLFYMDMSTQEYHPTTLGWMLLSILAWFLIEYFVSTHFYPRYSLSCDFGICVYPDAPRFPFIIPTLLWRWSGIPFVLTTVWHLVSVAARVLMGMFDATADEEFVQHVPSGTRHSASSSPIEPIPAPIAAEFGAI